MIMIIVISHIYFTICKVKILNKMPYLNKTVLCCFALYCIVSYCIVLNCWYNVKSNVILPIPFIINNS